MRRRRQLVLAATFAVLAAPAVNAAPVDTDNFGVIEFDWTRFDLTLPTGSGFALSSQLTAGGVGSSSGVASADAQSNGAPNGPAPRDWVTPGGDTFSGPGEAEATYSYDEDLISVEAGGTTGPASSTVFRSGLYDMVGNGQGVFTLPYTVTAEEKQSGTTLLTIALQLFDDQGAAVDGDSELLAPLVGTPLDQSSTLSVTFDYLDGDRFFLIASGAVDVTADEMSPVPLPAAAWLFISALGVLGARARYAAKILADG